ncbi:MAG TPA: hypothetical protein VFK15_04045 [Burkholderiales bacterium]|jgi:hypothetical protein|nr:hypothetical protein [Burkholderiales bacterium]
MPESNPLPGERSLPRFERRKPDPSTVQAWEALATTEAELSATRAKLASTLEALGAAREREERLLRMLERRQVRLPHLAMAVAAAVVIGVVLTLVAVRYQEALGLTSANRTSMVQQDVGPSPEPYSR